MRTRVLLLLSCGTCLFADTVMFTSQGTSPVAVAQNASGSDTVGFMGLSEVLNLTSGVPQTDMVAGYELSAGCMTCDAPDTAALLIPFTATGPAGMSFGSLMANVTDTVVGGSHNFTFTGTPQSAIFPDASTLTVTLNLANVNLNAGDTAMSPLYATFLYNSFPSDEAPEPASVILFAVALLPLARRKFKA